MDPQIQCLPSITDLGSCSSQAALDCSLTACIEALALEARDRDPRTLFKESPYALSSSFVSCFQKDGTRDEAIESSS